jgi:ComF family protein
MQIRPRQPLTEFFAARMAERIGVDRPAIDYLLPMPLHPARLAQRGFNQAAEIARRLSPRIGVFLAADACQRVRNTPSQAGLDLKTRQRNLRGAFVCNIDLSGKRVALIDDVMTSGSSLDELASVVRKSGAVEIQGLGAGAHALIMPNKHSFMQDKAILILH